MACQNSHQCNTNCNKRNSSTNQVSNYWIVIILYILLAIIIGSFVSWY